MQSAKGCDHIGCEPEGQTFGEVRPEGVEKIVEMGVVAWTVLVIGYEVEAGGGEVC